MKRIYLAIFATVIIFLLAVPPVTAQQNTMPEEESMALKGYKDLRFAIGGGYASRIGKIEKTGDSKIDDLSKKLRNGFSIDAEGQYFFKEKWGLGLNVNYCSSSTSGNNIDFPNVDRTIVNYRESQHFLFAGPSYAVRAESSKFLLIASVAIGPLFYINSATLDGMAFNGNETVLGSHLGITGEYKLNEKTGVGLKISYTEGVIDTVDMNNKEIKFSATNFIASAFISFRTW